MDIETIAVIGGFVLPIYIALFEVYLKVGRLETVFYQVEELTRKVECLQKRVMEMV